MILESLPTTPRPGELIDKVSSWAARMGRMKQSKSETQQSMFQTTSDILSDNLESIVVEWSDFKMADPFYYELADVIVDIDEVRKGLSEVMWASRRVDNIAREYQPELRETDADLTRKHRKQTLARMASVAEEVEDDLLHIGEARGVLKDLPNICPDEPAAVITDYPSISESSSVNDVIRALNEIARHPFTTKGVQIGHFGRDRIHYQIVSMPGLLDRPEDECNDIERQAVSVLEYLAGAVLSVADASGVCGYPTESQLELCDAVKVRFEERNTPILTVCNKSDRLTDMDTDIHMSVEIGENIEAILDAAVEAIGFEPDVPPSRNK